MGFAVGHGDQGELVEGINRFLHCSGQIRGQMEAALTNIEAVLNKAGLTRSNILTLRFFTTDVDGFLANYDIYAQWIGAAAPDRPDPY